VHRHDPIRAQALVTQGSLPEVAEVANPKSLETVPSPIDRLNADCPNHSTRIASSRGTKLTCT
jgi:hypothetical protein